MNVKKHINQFYYLFYVIVDAKRKNAILKDQTNIFNHVPKCDIQILD